jgi:hypothetical protein
MVGIAVVKLAIRLSSGVIAKDVFLVLQTKGD